MKKIKILMMVTLGLIISSSAFSRSGKGWKGLHPPGFPTKSKSGVDGFSKALTKQKDPQIKGSLVSQARFVLSKSKALTKQEDPQKPLDTSSFMKHSKRMKGLERDTRKSELKFESIFRSELDKKQPDMKKIIEVIKGDGVSIYMRTSEGHSLLTWAIRNRQSELALLLMEKGAKRFERDSFGWDMLSLSVVKLLGLERLDMFVGEFAVPELRLPGVSTTEIFRRYYSPGKVLSKSEKVEISDRDYEVISKLAHSFSLHRIDIVKNLFVVAAEKGDLRLVDILYDKGGPSLLKAKSVWKPHRSALYHAIWNERDRTEVVVFLKERGAKLSFREGLDF